MKRWSVIVLAGVFVAGGVYIYLHRQELGISWPSAPSPANSQPFRPVTISWALVDRSQEGFKLEMPADSREIEVPAYNETGGVEQVDMIYSYPDPSTSFSVSWADSPPVMRSAGGDSDQTLEDARNGALNRTQTVLVTEAQSTRQGFPVRDFVGRNKNGGIFNARLILADRRLYMMMAAFPATSARRDDDVNHFFDSFRIVSTVQSN